MFEFISFLTLNDHQPLASASVGQVHAAVLDDGQPVVIKIQKPAARAKVTADLDIVLRLAPRLQTSTTWGKSLGVMALAEGFADSLTEESTTESKPTTWRPSRRPAEQTSWQSRRFTANCPVILLITAPSGPPLAPGIGLYPILGYGLLFMAAYWHSVHSCLSSVARGYLDLAR